MRRLPLAAALAALAAAPAATAAAPLTAQTSFSPAAHFFGDPITARVDVALDPARVDPGSVAVSVSFGPYAVAHRTVQRLGGGPHLLVERFVYALRCTSAACVPGAPERTFAVRPAAVRFRLRGGEASGGEAAWPPLIVASRLTAADRAKPAVVAAVAPPAPGYRLAPGPLGWGLVAGGAVLAAGGLAALATLLRPRRRAVAVPALVLALELVERASAAEVGERRRALYRLALALEDARLEPAARIARRLAWAAASPESGSMQTLAAEVRDRLQAEAA